MKLNLTDWQSLGRDAERGYEIMGREGRSGWEVDVRCDNGTSSKHPERKASGREQAVRIGREIATMRDS